MLIKVVYDESGHETITLTTRGLAHFLHALKASDGAAPDLPEKEDEAAWQNLASSSPQLMSDANLLLAQMLVSGDLASAEGGPPQVERGRQ